MARGRHLHCTNCSFVNYINPRPTVSGILVRDGKLLLTKRKNDPFKGDWDFPGGFMEREESAEAAIRREMLEETGLSVEVKDVIGIYPGLYPLEHEPVHILSIAYLLDSASDKVMAMDDAEEACWFALDALPENIAFNNAPKILADAKRFVDGLELV